MRTFRDFQRAAIFTTEPRFMRTGLEVNENLVPMCFKSFEFRRRNYLRGEDFERRGFRVCDAIVCKDFAREKLLGFQWPIRRPVNGNRKNRR